MKQVKISVISCVVITILSFIVYNNGFAEDNPYPKNYTYNDTLIANCTFVAWQQTYDRLGIVLSNSNWGHATNWYSAAAGMYDRGSTPRVNSIVCYSGDPGHVAYVTGVSGNQITVVENGDWNNTYENSLVTNTRSGVVGAKYGRSGEFTLQGYIYLHANLGDDFYANIAATGNEQWIFLENDEGNVQLCKEKNDYTNARQQWHFVRQQDGSYRIINMYDGGYLNANQMGWAGYNVDLYSYLDWEGQCWYIFRRGNWYNIVPKYNTELCLDVKDAEIVCGTNIQLWDRTGNEAQLFDIYKYPDSLNLGDDFYANIAATGNGQRVFLENNEGNVQLCEKKNDSSNTRQQWHFVRQQDGSYRIINLYDGGYLNANQMGWAGYNVDLYSYLDWEGQNWHIVRCGDWYSIVPKYNKELCLDVKDAEIAYGTNIQLWDRTGHEAQQFDICKFDYAPLVPYENTLTLPDSTTTIESEAFAGLTQGVNIVISEKVTSISANAFANSKVIIICPQGSYAEQYAIDNGIPYINE